MGAPISNLASRFHSCFVDLTKDSRGTISPDTRQRLTRFWIPSIEAQKPEDVHKTDSNELLLRCGFIRQTASGLFHYLPLGVRVLEKLERLIDKHMSHLGASKVSLSSISSVDLWRRSGRLEAQGQLFHIEDSHGAKFLLSPTHEEEITALVGKLVESYKELPLRLYQITRKYRDEYRPREGLLRGREFLMKDLYTFDSCEADAMMTYDMVGRAYKNFLDDLRIPHIIASATSGTIGGTKSHEYHLVSNKGEDCVIKCDSCDYVANEELAERNDHCEEKRIEISAAQLFSTIENDGATAMLSSECQLPIRQHFLLAEESATLVRIVLPDTADENNDCEGVGGIRIDKIKQLVPKINTNSAAIQAFIHASQSGAIDVSNQRVVTIFDRKILCKEPPSPHIVLGGNTYNSQVISPKLDLGTIKSGDSCANVMCSGKLQKHQCVELGHTFHLGTRYSDPLGATVAIPRSRCSTDKSHSEGDVSSTSDNARVSIVMGCHGIGISRIIAAVANDRRDDKGLTWPRAMAPFEVAIINTSAKQTDGLDSVYDQLSSGKNGSDCIIDDRPILFGAKMKDADLIGYPIIVVIGKGWTQDTRQCEVQCRQRLYKENVPLSDLRDVIQQILATL